MKIGINDKGTTNETIIIYDIRGDMGEECRLTLLQQPDGDVVIGIGEPGKRGASIEFCTSRGGGHTPIIALKLRELIAELKKEEIYDYKQ